MLFTDSHAHLSFMEECSLIISRAKQAGVAHIVNICSDVKSLLKGVELAKEYPFIVNVGATSPHEVEKDGNRDFDLFASFAKEKKLAGIGESGLDYFYKHSSQESQRLFLKRYFKLALALNLPIVLHCRDAFHDLFSISDDHFFENERWGRGIIHCFSGTLQDLEQALKRKWFISFSGIITYPKNEALREVVKATPLESMLLESDAPYLAPQSRRGQINEPAYIVETALLISTLKKIPLEEVAQKTTSNALNLFFSHSHSAG